MIMEKSLKNGKKRIATITLLILFFIFIETVATRVMASYLATGQDNYIAILISEHWYRTVQGIDKFNDLGILFPIKNSVGVLDLMLHLGIPYTIFRMIGMNMYLSFLLAAVLIHAIGTLSILYLLNKECKYSVISSMIGTAVFSIACSYLTQTGHIYLLALSFIPLLFILVRKIMIAFEKTPKILMFYGTLFMCVLALVCYSSIYVALFFLVFYIVYLLVELCMDCCNKFVITKDIFVKITKNIIPMSAIAVFGIVLMIPFIKIYLPLFKEMSGGYSSVELLLYSPVFSDLWNVGTSNIMYGKIIAQLGIAQGETTIGLPLIESFLVIASFFVAIKKRARNNVFSPITLAIATLICWVMIVKWNGNFSIWALVRTLLPGLGSMRAIARFCLFLLIPISIVLSWFIDYIAIYLKRAAISKNVIGIIGMIVLILIIAENGTTQMLHFNWNYSMFDQIENSNSVAPPKDCESFFVVDSSHSNDEYNAFETYAVNIRGWSIGYKYNIKCINGIGSIFPYGSYALFNVYDASYNENVFKWIIEHDLHNVYGYDLYSNQWIKSGDFFSDISYFVFAKNGVSYTEMDGDNSWNWVTDNSATIVFSNVTGTNDECSITFETDVAPNKGDSVVEIYQDGELLSTFIPGEDVNLSVNIKDKVALTFNTSGDLGFSENGDGRKFAFMIKNLYINDEKISVSSKNK